MAQTTADPNTELRRLTRRIDNLRARQGQLIAQLSLAQSTEKTILSALDMEQEITSFITRDGVETTDRQRHRILLSKKVSRIFDRLSQLPDSDAKAAAMHALANAAHNLLETFERTSTPYTAIDKERHRT